MNNKDFLSQFSDENKKPDSFKEEVRIPVNKKPLNVKAIAIAVAAIALIGGLAAWFFLRPTIEVPDFIGQDKSEVSAWVKQQGIAGSGIRAVEEYSFDYDADIVIDQSLKAGSKVKKDAKLTVTVSLGADPDEYITFPDLKSMNRSEIELWIKNNKLKNVKISTSYHDEVEKDKVINYEVKNAEESEFKRGTNVTIVISKGVQPAGTVTVEDFKDKSSTYVEEWAKKNKIELSTIETFNAKVEEGFVISQSVAANKTMKQGEKLTIYVSKGAGVKVPNLSSMTKEEVDNWVKTNGVAIKEMYSGDSAYALSQSIKANTTVSKSDLLSMTVTLNKGNGFYLSDEGLSLVGSYDKLKDRVNELKGLGINISLKKTDVYDGETEKGEIVSHSIYTDKQSYSDIQKLPLSITIEVSVSTGYDKPEPVPDVTMVKIDETFKGRTLAEIEEWADEKGFSVKPVYVKYSDEIARDTILSCSSDKEKELPEGSVITVKLCYGNEFYFDEVLSATGFEIIGTSIDRVKDWAESEAVTELGLKITVVAAEDYDTKITYYTINGNGRLDKVNTTEITIKASSK